MADIFGFGIKGERDFESCVVGLVVDRERDDEIWWATVGELAGAMVGSNRIVERSVAAKVESVELCKKKKKKVERKEEAGTAGRT